MVLRVSRTLTEDMKEGMYVHVTYYATGKTTITAGSQSISQAKKNNSLATCANM